MDIIKKLKGKSKAIIIDDDIRSQIKDFKNHLIYLCENDEVRPIDKISTDVVLNMLDEYDTNILILYYICDCSPSLVGRVFRIEPSIISKRITKILKYVRTQVNSITDNNSVHS